MAIKNNRFISTKLRPRQVKRMDLLLPDDVLLDIFDFHVNIYLPCFYSREDIEAWKSLVHVCRRWRSLVLGSPRGLNLRLYCSPETPTRRILDIWPAFPLFVGSRKMDLIGHTKMDNILAALEQSNRVCQVDLSPVMGSKFESVLALMQVPFPELTRLRLSSSDKALSLNPIPDSFLGGSAPPRLQSLELRGILFWGLPKMLSSATHLVELCLDDIPHSGYISPIAMVTLISVLSSLRTLFLCFKSPQSRPDRESQSLPAPKRSIIPALREFNFRGVTEYLEDFLTRIDTPQLDITNITFLNKFNFGCPRLVQFINCTPKLRAPDEAHVQLRSVKLQYRTSEPNYCLMIRIPHTEPYGQLSAIKQVCNSSLRPLSMVENLYIEHEYWYQRWNKDAIENTLWSQLLLPYTAVKNLHLSHEFAPSIAAVLQELVGDRITEVLPSLQNIFVEVPGPLEPFQEIFGQFVTARQLSGHPVAILLKTEYPVAVAYRR